MSPTVEEQLVEAIVENNKLREQHKDIISNNYGTVEVDGIEVPTIVKQVADVVNPYLEQFNHDLDQLVKDGLTSEQFEALSRQDKEDRFVITENGRTQREVNASKVDRGEFISALGSKADKVYVDELIINANNGITNYKTEVELLAFTPSQMNYTAKALDTKKVWLWDGQWNDTGLSELDLSKLYVDRLVDNREELLDVLRVEDNSGQITLRQTSDAHLHVPHISGSVQENINNIKDRINHDLSEDILQLHDSKGNVSFRQKSNGDVEWSGSDKTLNEHFESIDSKISKTEDDDNLVVYDRIGNKIAVFTANQDLVIGQLPDGIGSKLNSEQLTSEVSTVRRSNYFLMQENVISTIMSFSVLNPVLRAPIPLNHVPLNFKAPDSLFSLQIEQPEMSKLNTVYQKDDGVVHPHIVEFYDKFNGAKYWLGVTGYYLTQDKFENPFLFASNDLKNFTMFDNYPQPLAERPVSEQVGDHQYNSDIFQFYDFHNGQLCMGYRTTRKKGTSASRNSLSYRSTKDGINWSEVKVLVPQTDGTGKDIYLSPSIIYDFVNNKYLLYVVDGENSRYELIRWECRFLGDKWVNRTVLDTPRHFTPWHCDVRYCGDRIVLLVQDNYDSQNMYLGYSDDNGNTFEFGGAILTGDFHKPYKATFLPVIDEYTKKIAINFIWTSRNLPENPAEKWRLYSQKTDFINLDSE